MKILLAPLLLFLCAFATPEHSTVEVTLTRDKDNATFVFQVVPKKDHQLTFDTAPWKLSLQNVEGFTTDRKDMTWAAADVDTKTGAFTVKGKAKPDGKLELKLNAFVCTKDKSRCYPQQHKKEVTWSNGQLKPS